MKRTLESGLVHRTDPKNDYKNLCATDLDGCGGHFMLPKSLDSACICGKKHQKVTCKKCLRKMSK
jgi:hypothetical protein